MFVFIFYSKAVQYLYRLLLCSQLAPNFPSRALFGPSGVCFVLFGRKENIIQNPAAALTMAFFEEISHGNTSSDDVDRRRNSRSLGCAVRRVVGVVS